MAKPNPDPLLTVPETAERLRSHPETVRQMLRRGDLVGMKFSSANRHGTWKVRESSIERFLRRQERAA
ncbi:helix-turn-helix domain-containing protein [Glutamicibacter sp.]|uniref:helix-turn-helix domain-containing protein n=1 Tax=Glutamicibacter sp. TaxID=1931995 RepID=UPI003D6AF1D5